jgi:hypothetical protein
MDTGIKRTQRDYPAKNALRSWYREYERRQDLTADR